MFGFINGLFFGFLIGFFSNTLIKVFNKFRTNNFDTKKVALKSIVSLYTDSVLDNIYNDAIINNIELPNIEETIKRK